MLRIGITCYPTQGGSGVVATELGKILAEKGHKIHFITYDMPFRLGGFHQNIKYHEVESTQYDLFKYPPYDLSLASKMAQVAKIENLDILHVHYAVPHAIAAVLAKSMVGSHLKVITTLHGTDITILGQDSSLKDIIRFGIMQSDAVTAVSSNLVEQTYELFEVEKPIELVYNFVDEQVYFPRNVSSLRMKYVRPDEKLLLHVSNFRKVKRVQDVIQIFYHVQKSISSRLLLVGEGPELHRIIQMVKDYSLSSKVIFLGKQDEVASLISLADILLLPSEKESFGLVALEAMSCGVPVIASNTGGLPEVIADGKTGYLSGVGDIGKMIKDTLELLNDEKKYKEFSEEGIKKVYNMFSSKKVVKKYEELYYRVLKEHRSETVLKEEALCNGN